MPIPTEPIGSIPRPAELLAVMTAHAAGQADDNTLAQAQDQAVRDTIGRFEETGSPVVTDGEQSKPSFATYALSGLRSLSPDGVVIPFADGHQRQLPVLTAGPFRYQVSADTFLRRAREITAAPVKQAVIAPSALSLLYPAEGLDGYSREEFVQDLVRESQAEIRRCLDAGAHKVQLDFTEGRLSVKLDPSGELLRQFVELNNQVLDGFSDAERERLGVHTCPGGDQDSTHSLDVDYAELLPMLFQLRVGNVYVQLASEPDRRRVLDVISKHVRSDQRVYIGVIDPINPVVETPEQVRDQILEAAEYLDVAHLGTCDDCGFSPFGDDISTSRDIAFAKIFSRIQGTQLAAQQLGV